MRTSPSTVYTMNEKKTSGADVHWVVKLTDGTSTWYFGDTMMELTEGFVYPILKPTFSINEQVDIYTKRWSIGTVTLTLKNTYFKRDSSDSDPVRVSDVIGDILGNDVILYCFAGSGKRITQISDALDRFHGKIIERMSYDADTITITCHDKGKLIHKKLPQSLISSVWSSAPIETLRKPIPIVYGEFTYIGDDDTLHNRTGLGLCKVFRISGSSYHSAVLCGHTVGGASNWFWYPASGTNPMRCYNTPAASTVSSCTLLTISSASTDNLKAYHYAVPVNNNYVGFTGASGITNASYVWDYSLDTYVSMAYDASPTIFGIDGWPDQYTSAYAKHYSRGYDTATTRSAKLVDIIGDSDCCVVDDDSIGTSWGWYQATFSSVTAAPTGIWFDNLGVNDDDRLDIAACIITVTTILPSIYEFYAVGKGRMYGTWIDDHSASAYVSTDLIEDPAGIIESILIDELGLTTTDIDMDSFDTAENSSVVARLNIHNDNAAKSDEIIRQLCEQSTFAFVFSSAGKAKLLPLNVSSPTTNLTIPLSWIKNDKIDVAKAATVINKLTVNSRYQQEYNDTYADVDVYEDATSQAALGEFGYTANWQNIAGTSAAHVAEHLVYASTGLWSNERTEVSFEMVGATGSRLELGDYIELDDETCDGRLLCYGASWSGKQFRIVKLSQTPYSTKITAIEI